MLTLGFVKVTDGYVKRHGQINDPAFLFKIIKRPE